MYCQNCGKMVENDGAVCACSLHAQMNSEELQQAMQVCTTEQSSPTKYRVLKVGLSMVFTAIILFLSLIPLLVDVVISMKNYSIMQGIFGSPFCGFANYKAFLTSVHFPRLFTNAIVQNLLFGLFVITLTALIGTIVIKLPGHSLIRGVMVTLFMIPVFIPDAVYGNWFVRQSVFAETLTSDDIAVWFFPFIHAIKFMGIPLLTTSVIEEIGEKKNYILPLQVGGCFALFSLMFISANDFLSTFLLYNPKIYKAVDSLDLYAYRNSLLQMKLSFGSAVAVVRQLFCLLSVAVLYMPFCMLAKRLFTFPVQERVRSNKHYIKDAMTSLIAIAIFFIVAWIPLMLKGSNIFSITSWQLLLSNPMIMIQLIKYIGIAGFVAVINVLSSLIIAYPVIRGRGFAKNCSVVMVLMLSVVYSLPFSVGTYIITKSLGMFNTYFAVIMGLIFPAVGVWSIIAVAYLRGVAENVRYIKVVAIPAVALVLIQMVYNMNNYIPSLLYTANRDLLSPILVYREIATTAGNMAKEMPNYDVMVFWYGGLLSIIPVGVLVLVRILFTNVSLLSILGLGQRK